MRASIGQLSQSRLTIAGVLIEYTIELKHYSDPRAASDGTRVLADPALPADIAEQDFGLDTWYPKAAPSPTLLNALRTQQVRFEQFAKDYRKQLQDDITALTPLLTYARHGRLTLLSAAQPAEIGYQVVRSKN